MKIHPVLADTGRTYPPVGGIHLLNAGWTATVAIPTPGGDYTLPSQALAVFVEAEWQELNKPLTMAITLVDDEGSPARMQNPDVENDLMPVQINQQFIVPPTPGAPNGCPGYASTVVDIPVGGLRIAAPRRRYIWRIELGGAQAEVGFWVNAAPQVPQFGSAT